MTQRHCIAALCHPRSGWSTEVARWATSGAAPVTLLTCMSTDELMSVLVSGRRISVVLLDGAITRLDRDLVADSIAAGARPVGVQSAGRAVDWEMLGVTSVLTETFGRDDLVAVLADLPAHARGAGRSSSSATSTTGLGSPIRRADVVAVCGSPGAGTSVTTAALASGLAARTSGRTLLVDGTRRGHQALYHDTADVIPSITDLVAKVRQREVLPGDLESLTFPGRGYRVLLGAPTPREADRLTPDTARELVDVLCGHDDLVVFDHDGDAVSDPLPGALATVADVWVIVTATGIKGLHDAAALTLAASQAGVDAERILVVLNRVPRRGPARSAFHSDLVRLVGRGTGTAISSIATPRVHMEARLRDAATLPRQFTGPLTNRVTELLRHGRRSAAMPQPAMTGTT